VSLAEEVKVFEVSYMSEELPKFNGNPHQPEYEIHGLKSLMHIHRATVANLNRVPNAAAIALTLEWTIQEILSMWFRDEEHRKILLFGKDIILEWLKEQAGPRGMQALEMYLSEGTVN
jgi:hypothetical protein